MATTLADIRKVAVVGAGVGGVAAAIHLKRAGLEVAVYERSPQAGGIWVFNEHLPEDPPYPSILPSVGDSPEYELLSRHVGREDSPMRATLFEETDRKIDLVTSFAPPGPCYSALKNNVSTIEMETTYQPWKPGTEEFVPHHVMADYIQDGAVSNDLMDITRFNTRVTRIERKNSSWTLESDRLEHSSSGTRIEGSVDRFDAVVIATGHYHACNVPDFPGLSEWKRKFPQRVWHSKRYRRPDDFKGQNVLLVGAGVSSLDIAKDLGSVAASVFQSSRGGQYDLPSHLLPDNAARVGPVQSFEPIVEADLASDSSIPGIVTLASGQRLCNIHQVILCTGYHVSFPFMRQYHRDGVSPEDADDEALVTNGQVMHNLHKDIFYIPDPTLAFIGVPYHTATFSLFDFQAMAVAAVYSGHVTIPSRQTMREEYQERVRRKGAGRTFHSLKEHGQEAEYVRELATMVNADLRSNGEQRMVGHSARFLEAYERRWKRQQLMFSKMRDPELDQLVLERFAGC